MICINHNDTQAAAFCVNCGIALCPECCTKTKSGKNICSTQCEESITKIEYAIDLIRAKTLKQNKVAGWVYFLLGGIFLSFSPFFYFDGIWQLSIFCLAFGVGMVIAGIWAKKVGKSTSKV